MHTLITSNGTSKSGRYGGVLLRSIIVFITLVVVGGAIFTLLGRLGQKQQINHRNALSICEYGFMVAMQQIHTTPQKTDGIKKTSYDEGWYKVSMNKETRNDTVYLKISAEGHCGSSAEFRNFLLRLDTSGNDTTWVPAPIPLSR